MSRPTDKFPAHLVVMALPQESRGELERAGAPLLYTGVGKVNAAAALATRLAEYRLASQPQPLVINLGTAGSRRIAAHTLVACNRFAQRDMDVHALGFAPGETPFDTAPRILTTPIHFTTLRQTLCSTADSFVTDAHNVDGDVFDMEAFALARVCYATGARFACAKFVTDGADGSSANDWGAKLAAAAQALAALYTNNRAMLADD